MSDVYPPPEEAEAPPARRNPLGWLVLGLLFAFMIFSATSKATESSGDPKQRVERYAARLRTAMATYEAGENPLSRLLTGDESPDQSLRAIERDAAAARRRDPVEAAAWGAARIARGQTVEPDVLRRLAQNDPQDPLIEAYRGGKRTSEEARRLASRLDARGPISKIVAGAVRRQAGLTGGSISGMSMAKAGLVGLAFLGLLFASGVAWVVAIGLGMSGQLRGLGPAKEVRSHAEADGLALKAALLFASFLGLQLVGGQVVGSLGLDKNVVSLVVYGGMLVVVPSVLGGAKGMAQIGLSLENLGRNVLLGLWAFLLELPVTATIALVCAAAIRGLPQPEHPASNALLNSPSLLTILVTFFGGALVAPFWEETMFRGLLFPALRRILRGPIPGALASSFLFASIHPQGPILWAALGSVALFSCFLAQKTRSLVPSVVMHFAHNATLLALTVVMAK